MGVKFKRSRPFFDVKTKNLTPSPMWKPLQSPQSVCDLHNLFVLQRFFSSSKLKIKWARTAKFVCNNTHTNDDVNQIEQTRACKGSRLRKRQFVAWWPPRLKRIFRSSVHIKISSRNPWTQVGNVTSCRWVHKWLHAHLQLRKCICLCLVQRQRWDPLTGKRKTEHVDAKLWKFDAQRTQSWANRSTLRGVQLLQGTADTSSVLSA